jgi:hypothetical protein
VFSDATDERHSSRGLTECLKANLIVRKQNSHAASVKKSCMSEGEARVHDFREHA